MGHNIARNLRLLGTETTFLTALGTDAGGDQIAAECDNAGIDLSHALRTDQAPTSTYLFIADDRGEMQLAVSDMEICNLISPEYLAEQMDVIQHADAVVVDTNLPEISLQWLTGHCKPPLFCDPVSVSKSLKLRPLLDRLDTLKPNRLEAELLSGITISGEEDLRRAADRLLESGLRQVFISLGTQGVWAAGEKESLRMPCCPAVVRNTTGAGDAFLAGLVWSRLHGLNLRQTALAASAAASIAVESTETVNPHLSEDALIVRMHEQET